MRKLILNFYCFLFILFLDDLPFTQSGVPVKEIQVLSNLYEQANGEGWRWRPVNLVGPKWNFSTSVINPCNTNGKSWQGIICTSSPLFCQTLTCSIVSIHLELYELTNTIPPDWSDMISLTTLDLSHNFLTGNLPQLLPSTLSKLNFYDNQLTGPIPSTFSTLTRLTYLHLGDNRLTNSLPSFLTLLPIQYFNLAVNLITGTIPETIGMMTTLRDVLFYLNILTGRIPTTFSTLTQLTRLDLSINLFKHAIPSEFGLLIQLSQLDLDYNLLTGTIPTSFGSLTSITQLNLEINRLSGSIPTQLGYLNNLKVFSLFSNSFTGSIPPTMTMSSLTWLELHYNHFTGPFPSLTHSTALEILSLQYNLFSSTLPCALHTYTRLSYLDMSFNYFTGWCHNESYLNRNLSPLLMTLILSSNLIHGPVPTSLLANSSNLEVFSMNSNFLTGSIPTIFQIMPHLHRLDLSHNRLEGSIPSIFGTLFQLNQLYLQNNHLTSSLFNLLQSTNMSLVNLDLSANKFSSTLPHELFTLPYLETVALTSNCFHGSFPDTICHAYQLRVLSMDGLGAASNCPGHIALPFSDVELKNPMSGELPLCIWNLTTLLIISLSDNGLTGTLGNIPINSSLINLTLSHNHLTGTIPKSFQSHEFVNLDLSYNKLIGSFSQNISKARRVILEVNRLSGNIQFSRLEFGRNLTRNKVHLNVLNGNLFECGDLPREDIHYGTYSCGSKTIDQSLIWLASILGLLTFLILFYALRRTIRYTTIVVNKSRLIDTLMTLFPFIRYLTVFHEFTQTNKHSSEVVEISQSLQFLSYLEKMVGIIAFSCIFFSLPLYILRSGEDDEYSTHINLYRWEWTAAYLTGIVPSTILLIAWSLVICIFLYCRGYMSRYAKIDQQQQQQQQQQQYHHNYPLPPSRNLSSIDSTDKVESNLLYCWSWLTYETFFYISINILVMGTVNASYIISTTQERDATQQFLIRFSLALFNGLWNTVCLPLLDISKQSKRIKLLTIAINTIYIPCIVTALTSPTCYQGLIVQSDEIVSNYVFRECLTYFYLSEQFFCAVYGFTEVYVRPFIPPFSYQYLCASTLLAAYLPVYIYIYSIQIVIYPLVTYLLAKYVPYSKLPSWIKSKLPGIIWPSHWIANASHSTSRDSQHSALEFATAKSLLKADDLVLNYLQGMLVLITFGLCCPPLAMAIALSLFLSLLQLRCVIGRFVLLRHPKLIDDETITPLSSSLPEPQSAGSEPVPLPHSLSFSSSSTTSPSSTDAALLALKSGIINLDKSFHHTAWIVVWSSCFFYILLCWDIAGDEIGWERSIWVPLSAVGFLLSLSFFLKLKSLFLESNNDSEELGSGDRDGYHQTSLSLSWKMKKRLSQEGKLEDAEMRKERSTEPTIELTTSELFHA